VITAFFNISGGELFVIILVVYIVFGPAKIPEIARWLGKGINEVKRATSEIRDEIDRETGDIRGASRKLKDDFKKEFNDLDTLHADPTVTKPEHAVEAEPGKATDDPYNLNDDANAADDNEQEDKEKNNHS
jgi:sec-independent protein translocase protein TatA